jgi:hypothetical protein
MNRPLMISEGALARLCQGALKALAVGQISGFLNVFGGMPREVWGGSIGFSIPTGLKLSAQGREERATLGENRQKSQPCKGCICFVNL